MALLIFTDLDGTLLNSDDYRFDEALPVLKTLQERDIPVIPVTSKTRVEVEWLRQQTNSSDPFVVENGSGAFIHQDDARFDTSDTDSWGNYDLKRFGCIYTDARNGLGEIAQHLGETLRGFGDLSVEDVAELTGLAPEEVERAQTREFTEPFVTPKDMYPKTLEDAAEKFGFRVVVGDRFSHLIGHNAGKGKAVRWLIEGFGGNGDVVTVGLGNSPNDLEMLEAVDRPIVVPDRLGRVHRGLDDRGWQVAPAAGCQGWAQAVKAILDEV